MAVEKKGPGIPVERFPKGEPAPEWTREAGSASRTNIPVYERVLIGTGHSAASALSVIGSRWDNAPYEGEPFTGSYVFKVDGHLFTVNVEPILDSKDEFGNDFFAVKSEDRS